MTDYTDAQQRKIETAEAMRRPTAPCGHPAWDQEGHCAEMSCRFYVNNRQDVGTAATDYEVEQFAQHMALSEGTARQALAYLEEQGWTPPGVEPGERQRPGKFEDESEPRFSVEAVTMVCPICDVTRPQEAHLDWCTYTGDEP